MSLKCALVIKLLLLIIFLLPFNKIFPLEYAGQFPIITFEEFISIALDAPRVVGIYPEIKNPIFINEHVSSLCLFAPQ